MDFGSSTVEYFEQLGSDKPLIRLNRPSSIPQQGSQLGSTFVENVALWFTKLT